MLNAPQQRIACLKRSQAVKKFEVYASGAFWIAVTVLMAAAALEPVELKARAPQVKIASAACTGGAAEATARCETIRL
jgi:hypothetical protein